MSGAVASGEDARRSAAFLNSLPRFFVEVHDAAMDCVKPPATHLMCVSVSDWLREIVAGYHVLVHNWCGGVRQELCREVVEREGHSYIAPRSFDPLPIEELRPLASRFLVEASPPVEVGEDNSLPDGFYLVAVVVARYWSEIPRLKALGAVKRRTAGVGP